MSVITSLSVFVRLGRLRLALVVVSLSPSLAFRQPSIRVLTTPPLRPSTPIPTSLRKILLGYSSRKFLHPGRSLSSDLPLSLFFSLSLSLLIFSLLSSTLLPRATPIGLLNLRARDTHHYLFPAVHFPERTGRRDRTLSSRVSLTPPRAHRDECPPFLSASAASCARPTFPSITHGLPRVLTHPACLSSLAHANFSRRRPD